MKQSTRKPSTLCESVQRHLDAYALAASAAGVGVLALAQPAQAKIVYTSANEVVLQCSRQSNLCLKLDVNHDHIVDFTIPWFQSSKGADLSIIPSKNEPNNRIWGTVSPGVCSNTDQHRFYVASALNSGVSIGPNSFKLQAQHYAMWGFGEGGSTCEWGEWRGVKNKYLGLEFNVKGHAHYGWARLSSVKNGWKLTGYAYETVANKPIMTGKIKGPDAIAFQPGSIGRLARGAAGSRTK
jgi:hypothetical protein